jgi:hypothetical protein
MLGDVRDPQLVGSVRAELAGHEIVVGDRGGVPGGEPSRSPSGDALETLDSHQPLHPLATDPDVQTQTQLGVYPRRPVGASRLAVDLADDRG